MQQSGTIHKCPAVSFAIQERRSVNGEEHSADSSHRRFPELFARERIACQHALRKISSMQQATSTTTAPRRSFHGQNSRNWIRILGVNPRGTRRLVRDSQLRSMSPIDISDAPDTREGRVRESFVSLSTCTCRRDYLLYHNAFGKGCAFSHPAARAAHATFTDLV